MDFVLALYSHREQVPTPLTVGITPILANQLAHPAFASEFETRGRHPSVQLAEGSWGKDGDFSYWLNDGTAWTWQRLWALEDAFWGVARAALDKQDDVFPDVLAAVEEALGSG